MEDVKSKINFRSDSEDEGEGGGQQGPVVVRLVPPAEENDVFQVRLVENEAEEYETDSGEEEEWWHPEVKQGEKVQVTELILFVLTQFFPRYSSPGMVR